MTNHDPRDPDITKKQQAKMWFENHHEARGHFDLARRLLVSYYAEENDDASHGYVNKKDVVEYRFNRLRNGYVSITGSIKHSTVRFFSIPKNSIHKRFRDIHWKEDQDKGHVDFVVSNKESAAELEDFLTEPFHEIENFHHRPSITVLQDACAAIEHTLEVLGVQKDNMNEVLREVWCRTPAHRKFRNGLMKKWGEKCALTRVQAGDLLVASHIKPWAHSRLKPEEQTCIDNGLMLASPIDKLFDLGYLTFDDEGTVQLHDDWHERHLSDDVLRVFGLRRAKPLKLGLALNAQQQGFLTYHRREIFLRQ